MAKPDLPAPALSSSGKQLSLRPEGASKVQQPVPLSVDPRLAILLRAGTLHDLVAAEIVSLDEAYDAILQAIDRLTPCTCAREVMERMERHRVRKPYQRSPSRAGGLRDV